MPAKCFCGNHDVNSYMSSSDANPYLQYLIDGGVEFTAKLFQLLFIHRGVIRKWLEDLFLFLNLFKTLTRSFRASSRAAELAWTSAASNSRAQMKKLLYYNRTFSLLKKRLFDVSEFRHRLLTCLESLGREKLDFWKSWPSASNAERVPLLHPSSDSAPGSRLHFLARTFITLLHMLKPAIYNSDYPEIYLILFI